MAKQVQKKNNKMIEALEQASLATQNALVLAEDVKKNRREYNPIDIGWKCIDLVHAMILVVNGLIGSLTALVLSEQSGKAVNKPSKEEQPTEEPEEDSEGE